MRLLHIERDTFAAVIKEVSNKIGINASYIEKDYYVFMILKLIRNYNHEIMFKGGTSLSKAWGILPRFSEDIDLNLLPEVASTDSSRQRFARAVYNSLIDMGFDYDYSKIRSRQEYNTFNQNYNALYKNPVLNEDIKIETMANKKGKILNATYTPRVISNYIWDVMSSNPKYSNILINFGLDPFEINTQNMILCMI